MHCCDPFALCHEISASYVRQEIVWPSSSPFTSWLLGGTDCSELSVVGVKQVLAVVAPTMLTEGVVQASTVFSAIEIQPSKNVCSWAGFRCLWPHP
jgi:hypothetical protein